MLYADYITFYLICLCFNCRNHCCGDKFNSYTLHICSSWTVFFLLFEPENSFIINKYLIVLFLLQICGSGGHSAYSEEIITLFISKAGCDGRPGSQLGEDLCGVCGGYNDCEDCSGKLNGGMISESEKNHHFQIYTLVGLILTRVNWPYTSIVCLFFVSQNLQNWGKYVHSFFLC